MSDNYAIDKHMERLQQEVAELRERDTLLSQLVLALIDHGHAHRWGDIWENEHAWDKDTLALRDQLAAAIERPAAVDDTPPAEPEVGSVSNADTLNPKLADWSFGGRAQPAPAEGIDVENGKYGKIQG